MAGRTFGNPAPWPERRHALVCVLVVALVCLVGAAIPAAAADAWPRIVSPNFVVTGEAPERDLRAAAEDLEAFRAALSRLYTGSITTAPSPTWVVVFKQRREFEQFLPRDGRGRPRPNVGGYFLAAPDVNYIVFGRYDAQVDRRVVLHEYAHSVMHRMVGAIPLWLSEGLADFYSTFDRDPRIAAGILGRPPADLLAVLRSGEFIGLDQIVKPRTTTNLLEDGDRARMFYAESWALVHYLLIGSPHAAPTNVALFLSELSRGLTVDDAFRSAFGETIDQVDVKLRHYVRQPNYSGLAVERGERAVPPAAGTPLSPAEAHRVRGDLLLRVGSSEEARRELSLALADAPSDVDAQIAMARVQLGSADHHDGLEGLLRIAAREPSSFAAQYYAGGALAVRRRYEEAFAAFNRATLLRDGSASAWFAFSTTALALGLDDAAEASLNRAMQLEFNPASYRNRAYAAFGFGRHEMAAADARRFINAVGMRDPSAQTVAFVAAIAYWRARQPERAAALLEDVRKAVPRASWNADLLDFMQGRTNADALLSRAKTSSQKTSAHTYVAFKALMDGRTAEALAHLRWVRDEGVPGEIDYGIAVEELLRLELHQPDLR